MYGDFWFLWTVFFEETLNAQECFEQTSSPQIEVKLLRIVVELNQSDVDRMF